MSWRTTTKRKILVFNQTARNIPRCSKYRYHNVYAFSIIVFMLKSVFVTRAHHGVKVQSVLANGLKCHARHSAQGSDEPVKKYEPVPSTVSIVFTETIMAL